MIELREVTTRCQLKEFVKFPDELYKDSPYYVPILHSDEYDALIPKRNKAFDFCEAIYFLAYKDGKIAGRIAGIINRKANETWNTRHVRFGWIDFIEDIEVAQALLDKVSEWGRSKGMTSIIGPYGFTDMDKEGMLTEGFDKMSNSSLIYNYPYYPEFLKRLGFEPEAQWIQESFEIPEKLPDNLVRTEPLIMKKYGLKFGQPKTYFSKVRYGKEMFRLINEAYAGLHQYSELTPGQIEKYVYKYAFVIDHRMCCFVFNKENKMVGFTITVPMTADAFRKAKGKLFPFGIFHLLKALRKRDVVELYLIGVLPEYQSKGATLMIFSEIHRNYRACNVKMGITFPRLVDNNNVNGIFDVFQMKPYVRRSCFIKAL